MNNSVISKLIKKYRYADITKEDIARFMNDACETLDLEKYLTEKIEEDINKKISDSDCKFQIISNYLRSFDNNIMTLESKIYYLVAFLEKYHIWFNDKEALVYVTDIPFLEKLFTQYFISDINDDSLYLVPPFVQLLNAYKKSIGVSPKEEKVVEEEYDIEDGVSIYFSDFKHDNVLTREEETYLGFRILAGDKEAFNILVERNLPLVISCLKKKNIPRKKFDEFVSVGNMALMKAASNFDIRKGYHFSTYAVNCIDGAIKSQLSLSSFPAKIYYYNSKLIKKIYSSIAELKELNGYMPSCEELAKHLNVSYEKVFAHLSLIKKPVYLDEVGYDALDENVLSDYIERYEFTSDDLDVLFDLLKFNESYKGIFKEYLIMKSTTLVAGNVCLSRARVGQILKKIERNIVKYQELLMLGVIDTTEYNDDQLRVVNFLKTLKFDENEADYKKIRTK